MFGENWYDNNYLYNYRPFQEIFSIRNSENTFLFWIPIIYMFQVMVVSSVVKVDIFQENVQTVREEVCVK